MSRLSVLVLTRNNEPTIAQCLDSVRGADEVLAFDSRSTDKTLEICRQRGARIYEVDPIEPGILSITQLRNLAIAKASNEWILFLDSDEILSAEAMGEIRNVISSFPLHDGFLIPRVNYFLGRPLRYGGWFSEKPCLFRRVKARFDERIITHEGSAVSGPLGRLNGVIHHHTHPHLIGYFEKFNLYSTLDALQMESKKITKRNRPIELDIKSSLSVLKFFFWDPMLWFGRRYILWRGYKDGVPGLMYALFGAFNEVVSRMKYWEMQLKKDGGQVSPAHSDQLVIIASNHNGR